MVPRTNRSEDAWAIWVPAAQATAAPPGGGPAGRIAMVGLRSVNVRPQLPQVSIAADRTRPHLGQASTSCSPDAERVAPAS